MEEISREAVATASEVISRIETRNEQGIANLLDLDRARSSYQDRLVRQVTDEKQSHVTLDQLKLVLGISPMSSDFFASIVPTEPFLETISLEDRTSVVKLALSRREELDIAKQAVASAEVKAKLATHLKMPTLDARASYALNGLGEDFNDSFDTTFSENQDSWDVGFVLEMGNWRQKELF